MAVLLPDDVVREILQCVEDLAALFRCATACKGWRRLFMADPSFLRRCFPEELCLSSPFPSILAHEWCSQRQTIATCIVPPRPLFGSSPRFLCSFIPNLDTPGFFDDAVPLMSRHGLLLVRLSLYHAGVHMDRSSEVLCMCNLLAGTFHVLPHVEHDFPIRNIGYAILTTTDFTSSNDNDHQQQGLPFKVIVLGTNGLEYSVRTFSSTGEPRWNVRSGYVEYNGIHAWFNQHKAVVCPGVMHWLFRGRSDLYTFDVSTETGHVSFTDLNLPTQLSRIMLDSMDLRDSSYDEPYLSVDIEGLRMLLCLQRDGIRLEIWTELNHGTWTNTRVLELTLPIQLRNRNFYLAYTCLGENNDMFVMSDNHLHVYIVDIKTGMMLEVIDWPRRSGLGRKATVSHEMNWPAFFTYRLGVGM